MPIHREAPQLPTKRSHDGLEPENDSSLAMDIDAPVGPPQPPPQQYAPRFSLAAPPAPETDDQTSAPRTKRRKRTSLKQTYKDASSSDILEESSLNGLSTPEDPDIPSHPPPRYHGKPHGRDRESHLRKDWPSSPPRSPDHPLFPDDRAFLGPSVVTRVPGLAPQFRQVARNSYGRVNSSEADDAPLKKKRPGPKPKGAGGGAAAKDVPSSSAAASDSAGKKRTKTGCE